MAVHKLSAQTIARATGKRRLNDGGGLYLDITDRGTKAWLFRWMKHGRTHYLGLGPIALVPAAEARQKAAELRRQLFDGEDPKLARTVEKAKEKAKGVTFGECVEAFIEANRVTWKNPKSAQQWKNTLATHAAALTPLPVGEIATPQILDVLRPIWHDKSETASRVRQRIEAVLDYARVCGYRDGENPARWRGHLDHVLPSPRRVRKVTHLASLPYAELPEFMARLRAVDGIAARALEFLILTAVRAGDIHGNEREDRPPMCWDHVDLDQAMWVIPATKMDTSHKVPLAPAAVALLRRMHAVRQGDVVFPGADGNTALSNNAMWDLVKELEPTVTVHGFRSSFRTWAAEMTNVAREIAESALAHAVGDEVEAAYLRGDFLAKRAKLMRAWASYCARPATSAKVIPMRAAK